MTKMCCCPCKWLPSDCKSLLLLTRWQLLWRISTCICCMLWTWGDLWLPHWPRSGPKSTRLIWQHCVTHASNQQPDSKYDNILPSTYICYTVDSHVKPVTLKSVAANHITLERVVMWSCYSYISLWCKLVSSDRPLILLPFLALEYVYYCTMTVFVQDICIVVQFI